MSCRDIECERENVIVLMWQADSEVGGYQRRVLVIKVRDVCLRSREEGANLSRLLSIFAAPQEDLRHRIVKPARVLMNSLRSTRVP